MFALVFNILFQVDAFNRISCCYKKQNENKAISYYVYVRMHFLIAQPYSIFPSIYVYGGSMVKIETKKKQMKNVIESKVELTLFDQTLIHFPSDSTNTSVRFFFFFRAIELIILPLKSFQESKDFFFLFFVFLITILESSFGVTTTAAVVVVISRFLS